MWSPPIQQFRLSFAHRLTLWFFRRSYDDEQRQAVRDAGALAGLTILRVINQPTAAAIAHGLPRMGGETLVLVYDLGGTSLDVSIISIDDGVFEILAIARDTTLGGEALDQRVVDHLLSGWEGEPCEDIRELRIAVERAKRVLSDYTTAKVTLEGIDFEATLTQTEFEDLNDDLILKSLSVADQALKMANVTKDQIDDYL
jgi:molecular chaperone DnaK (HSP70)